jgi:hypothetical protein
MPPVPDWKEIVQAAWDSIKGKIATDLPRDMLGKTLSDQTSDQETGVCVTLNGPNTAGVWNDDGPGTIHVSSLRVSNFTSVSAGSVKFGTLDVQLPLPFALLEASGRYAYVQPCALYNFGKKGPFAKLTGAGQLGVKSENATLTYLMKVIDPGTNLRLELTRATIEGGQQNITVQPDGTPDNAFLRWLFQAVSRGPERLIRSALDSFFATDQFSKDMVSELNRIIGVTLAERAQG